MQRPVVTTLLPREEEASQPKGWIQGNIKIGPVLEVATSFLHGKYGIEIRIWSVGKTILILGSEYLMELTNT